MFRCILIAVQLNLALVLPSAHAHYLWITLDQEENKPGTANIYFEESASVGDGHYIGPYLDNKSTWVRTIENINPQLIKLKEERSEEDKRWATATVPSTSPKSIETYWKAGVYTHGETSSLLYYYARHLDVTTHEDLHDLCHADHMDLNILAHGAGDEMELKVTWKDKPVVDTIVYITSPENNKENIKTDEKGLVRFKVKEKGEYSFLVKMYIKKKGKDPITNQEYSQISHRATLIMSLPLKE